MPLSSCWTKRRPRWMRTVENADQIVVLEGGVVAEYGTHEELMWKNGLYRKLVELQTAAADRKLRV